jgi:raffinose/stachyose/melibiose transport system permease protein
MASRRFPRRSSPHESYGIFLYPAFFVMATFVVGLLIWNFGISLMNWPGYGAAKFVGIDNYVDVVTNQAFWDSFRNANYYILPMALIPTALGLIVSVAVFDVFGQRLQRWAVPVVRGGLYLPQVIPIAISAVIWGWMLDNTRGLVNVMLNQAGLGALAHDWLREPNLAILSLSVIMVWLQVGFSFVIFLAGLSRVDMSLVESAQLDGASWWQRLRFIIMPQLRAEISVVLLLGIVGALKVFGPVYYVTRGGPNGATNSPALLAVSSFFGNHSVGYGSAVSTILAIVLGVGAAIVLSTQRSSTFGGGER